MLKQHIKCLGTIIFACIPFSAYATLIDMDDITRDTDTGLDWLDVWQTALACGCDSGFNFNNYYDILALTEEGEKYEGFRFATESEIITLFTSSAGIGDSNKPKAAWNLTLLLDYTFGTGSGGEGYGSQTKIMHGWFDNEQGDPGSAGQAILSATRYYSSDQQEIHLSNYSIYENQDAYETPSGYAVGGFLVRSVAVPEPSQLGLLIPGLLTIALARRKKAGKARKG